MKKGLIIAICIVGGIIVLGVGTLFAVGFYSVLFNNTDKGTEQSEEVDESKIVQDFIKNTTTPLNANEIEELYTDPDKFEGRKVVLKGKVFGDVEREGNSIAFQMFADPENSEKNTVVYAPRLNQNIEDEDYVEIEGTVKGSFEGENAFGGDVDAVTVKASKVKKISYQKAASPTQKKYIIKKTINQRGYKVTLKKVEIAPKETRVYLKVKNNGSAKFDLYTYSAKIIQGSRQYEEESNYDAEYEELPDEIDRGVKANGIITFPRIKGNKDFKFKIEGSSDNFDEDLSEYVFNVHIK